LVRAYHRFCLTFERRPPGPGGGALKRYAARKKSEGWVFAMKHLRKKPALSLPTMPPLTVGNCCPKGRVCRHLEEGGNPERSIWHEKNIWREERFVLHSRATGGNSCGTGEGAAGEGGTEKSAEGRLTRVADGANSGCSGIGRDAAALEKNWTSRKGGIDFWRGGGETLKGSSTLRGLILLT